MRKLGRYVDGNIERIQLAYIYIYMCVRRRRRRRRWRGGKEAHASAVSNPTHLFRSDTAFFNGNLLGIPLQLRQIDATTLYRKGEAFP